MTHLQHFTSLVLEYCLFPIVLFILVFVARHKQYQLDKGSSNPDQLRSDGFEFVLIEAFAGFSLFVRLVSEESPVIHADLVTSIKIATFTTMFCMFSLFFYGWIKSGRATVKEVTDFQITSYACFSSWWSRIAILGLYSEILGSQFIGYLVLVIILGFSFYLFKRFMQKYFINWTVLFRQMTAYIRMGKSSKAMKKGKQLLNQFNSTEGDNYLTALGETSAELGMMYFHHNDPPRENLYSVIYLLESFLKKSPNMITEKQMHGSILVGIYCKIGEETNALNAIWEYLPKDQHDDYIRLVKSKEYNQIFLWSDKSYMESLPNKKPTPDELLS